MLEKYILIGDGKDYVDVDCVREALGIKDDEDIFRAIEKLKKERDGLKAELELTNRLYKENRNFVDKVCGAVDIQRPCLESGYANAVRLITGFKRERDELKEKCDKLKLRANAAYGASCGYSSSKEPAFLCDVISYSWSFGAIDTPFPNNSIRVELNLTPTANYKGTIDMEDLKRYIQNYGREKKLGVVESVDYQNAKAARSKLAYLYKQVLGKEKLDRDLSPHEIMKAILDEYDKREDFIRELSCSLGFGDPVVKPDNIDQKEKDILERIESLKDGVWPCENSSTFAEHLRKEFPKFCKRYNVVPLMNASIHDWIQYIFDVLSEYRGMSDSGWARAEKLIKEKRTVEDSLAELRAKIREIYRSVVDDEWDGHLSYTSAMNDINEEYKRIVHNFEERTADWSKAQQELDRYRLAVGSLLDIPKESRDDINAIERSFTFSKKQYESLKEFRDNVCEILDIPSSMADDQKQILKEIHDFADRYYELRDFRADICEVLGIDADELFGSPQQNDQYILEQVEKLKGGNTKLDRYARLRSNICTALCLGCETSDAEILKAASEARKERNNLIVFRNDVAKAVCSNPNDSNADILKAVEAVMEYATELQFNTVDKDNVVQPAHSKTTRYKSLQEFRDNVYKELGLPRYGCTLTEAIDELKKRLNRKDYTDLRKAIWEAMDRNPETLPEETARLVGEVTELARGEKLLIEFRDDVAKAIGMNYPTTNQAILHNLRYIYKDRGDAYGMVASLNDNIRELSKAKDDLQQKFQFQSGLRQLWRARYDSEHARYESELETAKKQYEKVCGDLETAECALNGMKSKVRSLQEEKTKVIAALGQDIWDDCVK